MTTKIKVLVTGGAGFLGSHICDKLLSNGNYVICADDLSTGNINNINHLIDNQNFEFKNHDITLPIDTNVSEIYNLASPASPIHYQMDPVKTTKTNVIGSIQMLDLAKKEKAKILQTSTSEVYGDPEVHPQNENYCGKVNPVGPRSCYDEGKRCAETLFFDYNRQFGLNIKVVRIFNTYGPRMHPNDGRVVSNFIVQALKGEDITIYGDGNQTRSFCYVDDLIASIILMMNTSKEIIGPINIGNPDEFTIKELADHVLNLTKSKSKIIYNSLPEDDPRQRKPDISKAKKFLKGWEPKVNLIDGLKETTKYFEFVLRNY